jgi:hypothetical protein
MRKIFPACRASAFTATASSTATTRMDKRTVFFIAHLVPEPIMHAAIAKTMIYGRSGTRFVKGKKANFDVGLN